MGVNTKFAHFAIKSGWFCNARIGKPLMGTYGLSKCLVTFLTRVFEVSNVIVFCKGSCAKKTLQRKGFFRQKRTISGGRTACGMEYVMLYCSNYFICCFLMHLLFVANRQGMRDHRIFPYFFPYDGDNVCFA